MGTKIDNTIEPQLRQIGVVLYDGEKVVIQRSGYIDDGWFIEINGDAISLFEIAEGGGGEVWVDEFSTLSDAIEAAHRLT